jgi:hypothetical protein
MQSTKIVHLRYMGVNPKPLTFWVDFFLGFRFKSVVEPRSVIPECYGTLHWDTLWMNYGWMKFGHLEIHPLIVHATWLQWECALGSRNALWVAYKMEELVLPFEGILNVSTWNVDFLDWLFLLFSFERSCRARKWNCIMIWQILVRHCMDELLTDEVCIIGTRV